MYKYPKAKILVVDDSAILRRGLIKLLTKLEINQITEAEDGQIALDILQQESFDMVLLDWEMPNMTGIELLEIIKGDEKLKSTPVIMITAKGDELLRAIKLGVDRFIMKPVSESVTLTKIAEILEKNKGLSP
ncbi:MAG: response regulator [SAR324 cluster bacterium]|nr:response regulator [SAR324 cluster bacterium]